MIPDLKSICASWFPAVSRGFLLAFLLAFPPWFPMCDALPQNYVCHYVVFMSFPLRAVPISFPFLSWPLTFPFLACHFLSLHVISFPCLSFPFLSLPFFPSLACPFPFSLSRSLSLSFPSLSLAGSRWCWVVLSGSGWLKCFAASAASRWF